MCQFLVALFATPLLSYESHISTMVYKWIMAENEIKMELIFKGRIGAGSNIT